MLNSIPAAGLVGLLLGFLTGLGTGGGSLLILWLTLVLGIAPDQARIINLMFFIPSAVISSIIRWRQGGIPFCKIWLPALAGCASAALFAILGRKTDTELLRKLFGALLIYTGIRELFYRQRKAR